MLALVAVPAASAGAAPVNWSSPHGIPLGGSLSAVSCPSEGLCVAVNGEGDAFSSADPTSPTPSWDTSAIDAGTAGLNTVSCAPAGPCAAVNHLGDVLVQLRTRLVSVVAHDTQRRTGAHRRVLPERLAVRGRR